MITTLLFDFSRVLLFPKNRKYSGDLNPLHAKLSLQPNYSFFDHFELNHELLEYLKTKIKSNYDLFIFTSGSIQNAPQVRPVIDKIFAKVYSGQEIGYSKSDQAAYRFLAKDLGKGADEVMFIDDRPSNISAATSAGLKAIHFVSNQKLIKELNQLPKVRG